MYDVRGINPFPAFSRNTQRQVGKKYSYLFNFNFICKFRFLFFKHTFYNIPITVTWSVIKMDLKRL